MPRTPRRALLLPLLLSLLRGSSAANPLVPGSMADPHVRIFNNRAYLYSGWDELPNTGFKMPSWRIYSSGDLVDWTLEATITPNQTGFMAANATTCWATDAAFAAGRYHFFYSNHNIEVGVLTAPTPTGPWTNETAGPLFPANLTGYPQYDPTILHDDDGAFYIMFGLHDATHFYFVARLRDDLTALAEPPRKVEWAGAAAPGDDKSTLHKFNGTYYLTSGSYVSTAASVYGPWTYRGSSSSDGRYGLTAQAHGNFFEWRGQWFHAWCYFVTPLPTKWRQSSLTYAHYTDDGRLVDDEAFLDAHNATGVGRYDAAWGRVEAEWFTSAGGNATTREGGSAPGGFLVVLPPGAWLGFPHVAGVPAAAVVTLDVAVPAAAAGAVELRAGAADGALLATCPVAQGAVGPAACAPLAGWPGGELDLYLVWAGAGAGAGAGGLGAPPTLALDGWAIAAR